MLIDENISRVYILSNYSLIVASKIKVKTDYEREKITYQSWLKIFSVKKLLDILNNFQSFPPHFVG